MFGNIKLGFKHKITIISSIYIKYHDIGKRKFFWTIWEKDIGYYSSYYDFKKSWYPKTKIWSEIKKEIKKDIRNEIQDLLIKKDPFNSKLKSNNINKHIFNKKHII